MPSGLKTIAADSAIIGFVCGLVVALMHIYQANLIAFIVVIIVLFGMVTIRYIFVLIKVV